MPIVAADILYKFSIKTGSAGNAASQSDGNESLGKYIATNEITTATLHALFDQVSGDENAASDVEYRCVFIHNNHATLTLQAPLVWLTSEVALGATAAISIDSTAASAIGASAAQALSVTDEGTAPSAITFSAPTTKGAGLSLGDLAAGSCRAVWIRRTANNSAAIDADGVTIRVEGDTAA
jgi:hypothetical protein